MYTYYLSGTNNNFKVVKGYQLPNNLALHNNTQYRLSWTITDVLSGMKIKDKFTTQKDALEYLKTSSLQQRLADVRKTAKYLNMVTQLQKYVSSLKVETRVPGWKRYYKEQS